MRPLISNAPMGLIEDDMADIARGRLAIRLAWKRLRNLCYRPLTDDDIDEFSKLFRELEAAMVAIDKYLQEERKRT